MDWENFLVNIQKIIFITGNNLGFSNSNVYIFMLLLGFTIYGVFSKNKVVQFINLLSIFFILINSILFEIFVKWSFQPRYGLIIVALLFIGFGLNLAEVFKGLNRRWLYFGTLALGLIYLLQFPRYQNERSQMNTDWRLIYSYFHENAKDNSVAYSLTYTSENMWFVDGFIAFKFYP